MPLLVILSTSALSQQIIQTTSGAVMLHSTRHLGEGDGEDGVRETEAPAPFAWRWVRSPTEGKEGRPGFCGTDEVTTQKTVGKNM